MSPPVRCDLISGVPSDRHYLLSRPIKRRNDDVSSTDRGQSTIEFALLLPLAIGCLLLVVQTLVIVLGQITLHHEARIAVRAAATAADPGAAAQDVLKRNDPLSSTTIDVVTTDQLVTVHLQRQIPVVVPLIGRLWPDIEISAQLSMALEPPLQLMNPS